MTLDRILSGYGSLIVAYSGGVDSAYLSFAAHSVLGARAIAVTADSPSLPRAELAQARTLAATIGIEHRVVRTDELTREAYLRNEPDRCFHCKEALFDELFAIDGFAHVALGTVTDDLGDVRPGLSSARARGAVQPLLDAGLSKMDVRGLAREAGLPVWDKPAAPCLSSRIPHGTRVTLEALGMVERAEAALHALGMHDVRVRHLGEDARVELPDPCSVRREEILAAVRAAGYREVVIAPYRRGGANLPVVQTRG